MPDDLTNSQIVVPPGSLHGDAVVVAHEVTEEIGRPAIVADRLVQIKAEIDARFIEMGELLLESKRGNYAAILGYANFEMYVEDRVKVGYRKALYLLEIFKVFIEDLQVPRQTLESIGWTRAKEIVDVIVQNPEQKQEWLERAQEKTTSELQLEVRKSQAPAGLAESLHGYRTWGVGLFDDEREIVERAIELAKREGESDRTGTALVRICQDYIGDAEARHAEAFDGNH